MPQEYKARQGDCISSIAADNGFFWETLWNHPDNAALKKKRNDPNVLLPGDIVHVPDKEARIEKSATEQKHVFKRKSVPAKLRMRLVEPEEEDEDDTASSSARVGAGRHDEPDYVEDPQQTKPRANVAYALQIEARTIENETDGDGYLEEFIPPETMQATLVVLPGTEDEETYLLELGKVDPIDGLRGVRERLQNLGYAADTGDAMTPALRAALLLFQEHNSIDMTGDADDKTIDTLKKLHGS